VRIILIEHAKERAKERGASADEIHTVLLNGKEIGAKKGRKGKELVFDYNGKWLGKLYSQKKVRVIYVKENDEVMVITVKVYYGMWR
jgi:Txe/YoeB family toxin of Txe-Axe toxin-antitoxin module